VVPVNVVFELLMSVEDVVLVPLVVVHVGLPV
jgi:hypothetical protein